MFDCTRCGACCQAPHPDAQWYVAVNEVERTKLPAHSTVVEADPRYGKACRMATSDTGRCVALDGHVGELVTCTVYEDRPAPCREFQNGAAPCRRARLHAGVRNS